MRKIPNILFSTTRCWNPGDDFILMGVLNIFKKLIPEFNSIIYDRNPDNHKNRVVFDKNLNFKFKDLTLTFNLYRTILNKLQPATNSWTYNANSDYLDLVVFAGTPEWLGNMVSPLEAGILQFDLPHFYLGIGAFEGIVNVRFANLGENEKKCLKSAEIITARDNNVSKILFPLPVKQIPCPALFSSPFIKKRTKIKRIALSMQTIDKDNQQRFRDPSAFKYCVKLFKLLSQHYDCALICHYIKELPVLEKIFGNIMPIYYSFEPRDYLSIYDKFDLSVTTRVHGAGICASMGIPSFVITHSTRSETVFGFLAETIDFKSESPEKTIKRIQQFPITEKSSSIIKHKKNIYKQYEKLLVPIFEKLNIINK